MVFIYNKVTQLFLLCRTKVNIRLSASIIGALALFLFLAVLLYALFPSCSLVECTIELEQDGRLQVFYATSLSEKGFNERDSSFSPIIPGGKKQTVSIPLHNAPIGHLRLDPGESAGNIKIFKLELYRVLGHAFSFDHTQIFNSFKPGNSGVSLKLEEDHLTIISNTSDPSIISSQNFSNRPWFLITAIPLLFSLLLFHSIYRSSSERIKTFVVTQKKHPSSGNNFDALDGLRGVAALMVVGDHCWGRLIGLGAPGVWIFMALSGFLLAQPFITSPQRILSLQEMKNFYLRRCRRIFPAYYTYIVVVFLISGNFDLAIRHFLFLEGDGHLWVVPQEIVFYLLIPAILFVNYCLFKGRIWLIVIFTGVAAVLTNCYLSPQIFALYGMANQKLNLYFGVFLSGISVAYLRAWIINRCSPHPDQLDLLARICSVAGGLTLLFLVLCSSERLWGGTKVFAQMYFGWYGGAAALLILCVSFARNTRLERFLTWLPFSCIGIVSFSFYLFHPLVLNTIFYGSQHFFGNPVTNFALFLSTAIISYFLACFIYHTIEKPFSYSK